MPFLKRLLPREPLAAKVPEIGVMFWVTKIVTTGMGEATSDFFGTINVPVLTAVAVLSLIAALWIQGQVRRYVAAAYWFVVVAVAVVGTELADDVHGAGLPYYGSVVLCAVLLIVVLSAWYRSEATLSIHSIATRRREAFYWLTVLATFALGTALGDFSAENLGLGLLTSGVVYGVIIVIPALAWWRFQLNAVVAFWMAYILTRPLGASFADYFDKSRVGGGLDMGNGPVSAGLSIAVIALVAFLAIRRCDIQLASPAVASESSQPAVE